MYYFDVVKKINKKSIWFICSLESVLHVTDLPHTHFDLMTRLVQHILLLLRGYWTMTIEYDVYLMYVCVCIYPEFFEGCTVPLQLRSWGSRWDATGEVCTSHTVMISGNIYILWLTPKRMQKTQHTTNHTHMYTSKAVVMAAWKQICYSPKQTHTHTETHFVSVQLFSCLSETLLT